MMRIKRKPLLLNAWHNSKGPRPGDKPAEPMPRWLQAAAEKDAKPETTFLLKPDDPGATGKLVSAGDVVYQAPDGGIHSISLDRFKQEYDVVDLQPTQKKEGSV
jgi:hypothetical protein